MKRAQMQLEESVYDQLRQRAFREKKSIASVIREIIGKEMVSSGRGRARSIKDFRFIAAGRSRQRVMRPVSEQHDEALTEGFKR